MLRQFTKHVYTDHLTNLKNRQALNDKLCSVKSNVLILSNIKEFSLINEFYGVDVGNEVLKQVATALDMKFVYGFIPNDKTLEKMIEKRATELARNIVLRTSTQMNLEDQKISDERINKAIKEKTEEIKNEIPKIIWD